MTATTSKLGADMKDHEIAQTVNQLRDIAKEYGQTQQLRERIAAVIVPILARQPAAIDGQEAERYRYLRNAVGVILDCSHAGPWKFGSNIDVVVDEWLAQKAARTSAPHPANEASKPAAPSVEQDERGAWDGDSEESRAAFRAYDAHEPVSTRSSWQIWRDACAWQARAASTSANVAQCATCGMAVDPKCGCSLGRATSANVAQWKQAIDDELVMIESTADSFATPREAVKALIDWHVSVALDPAVSREAQALVDKGKSDAANVAQGAEAVAWREEAQKLFTRCKLWPEKSDDGFMALLELRNHVEKLLKNDALTAAQSASASQGQTEDAR